MSTASALLSMIAPAAPTPSQGSVTADASAFEGLLASMMSGDMAGNGEDEAALPTEKTLATDAALTGTVTPAVTLALAPQPLLLIPDAPASTDTPILETTGDDTVEAAPTPDESLARPAPTSNAAPVDTDLAGTATTPLPMDKSPAGKGIETGPQVRPTVKTGADDDAQVRPTAPADVKTPPTGPETRPPAPSVRATRHGMVEVAHEIMAEPAPVSPSDITSTPDSPATPQTQPLQPATDDAKSAADPAVARPQVQPPLSVATEVVADLKAAASAADKPATAEAPDPTTVVAAPVPEAGRKLAELARSIETPALRSLAERASRADGTNAAVDTAAPAPLTVSGAVTPPPSAMSATSGTPSPQAAPAVAPTDVPVDASDTVTDAPVDAATLDSAPSAEIAQAAREALSPTQSRAAVEATAQIAAQILKRLDGRSSRFEMALTPDDMGRIDIKLDIDAEGRLSARLAFDNPAAAADLKGRTDELRRELEQQGFHVAEDAFEFTQRDSGSSAFDRGQDARQGQSRAFAAASRLNADADVVAQPQRWSSLTLTPAGVDMKV